MIKKTNTLLTKEAKSLGQLLKKNKAHLVLAESCTGGMIASALTQVPGISTYFCGSAVVYRDLTKNQWLKIPKNLIKKHGDVSEVITLKLAKELLKKTSEADLSLAITGHLGPNSPKKLDGIIFISIAMRQSFAQRLFSPQSSYPQKDLIGFVHKQQLLSSKRPPSLLTIRQSRQLSASHSALLMVRSLLEFSAK